MIKNLIAVLLLLVIAICLQSTCRPHHFNIVHIWILTRLWFLFWLVSLHSCWCNILDVQKTENNNYIHGSCKLHWHVQVLSGVQVILKTAAHRKGQCEGWNMYIHCQQVYSTSPFPGVWVIIGSCRGCWVWLIVGWSGIGLRCRQFRLTGPEGVSTM